MADELNLTRINAGLKIYGNRVDQGKKDLADLVDQYGWYDENGGPHFYTRDAENAYNKRLSRLEQDEESYQTYLDMEQEYYNPKEAAPAAASETKAWEDLDPEESDKKHSFIDTQKYGWEKIGAGALGVLENINDIAGIGVYGGTALAADLAKSTPMYQNWLTRKGKKNPDMSYEEVDGSSFLTKISDFSKEQVDSYMENSITEDYNQSIEERYQPSDAMKAAGFWNEVGGSWVLSGGLSKALAALKGAKVLGDTVKGANIQNILDLISNGAENAREAKAEGATREEAIIYSSATAAMDAVLGKIVDAASVLEGDALQEVLKRNPNIAKKYNILKEGILSAFSDALKPSVKNAVYSEGEAKVDTKEVGQNAFWNMLIKALFEVPDYTPYVNELDVLQKKHGVDSLEEAFWNFLNGE